MGKHHADINEVIPTAKQQREAMQASRDNARVQLGLALSSLDSAQEEFKWMGADDWYRDCATAIAMVEDLQDSMDGGFDSAA